MMPFAGVVFWCAVAVGVALNLIVIYLWSMRREYEVKNVAHLFTLAAVVDVLMVTAVLKVLS